VRTHGGAAPAEQVMFEFQFLERQKVQQEAKQRIGSVAASLVRDGQSVMLDSSTTTLAVARQLVEKRVTIITTSLPIASVLQQAAGVETLLLGGFVRRESADLGGALTEANLESLRADVAFVGADAIDRNGNAYNASLNVARMLGKMMASASDAYLVADSSKIGKTALVTFGNAAKWKGLITDAGISLEQREALSAVGVNVIVAGAAGAAGAAGSEGELKGSHETQESVHG
jgi:DeoR family fructose operon transcriptional repressor